MENITALPVPVSFDEAKLILNQLHKFVSEDWAFGDAEAYWVGEDGKQIAGSYVSGGKCSVWFTDNRVINCTDNSADMHELNNCYAKITRGRNDSLDQHGE